MIIGSPKCGTTSLFDYVASHPDVQRPALKEVCYFSTFKRWLQRYRKTPASDWALYVASFGGRLPAGRGNGRGRGRRQLGLGRALQQQHSSRVASLAAAGLKCEAAGRQSFEACPFYLGEVGAAAAIRRVFPQMRAIAILRNPRARTISAFNDYVRMGRIRGHNASTAGMDAIVGEKIALLRSGRRTMESYDMRILTSGVYVYGLRAWGVQWPSAQLLVLRSEDLFADTPATMARVQSFLGLARPFEPGPLLRASNRNTDASRSAPSNALERRLDDFFSPYNEELYAWLRARGMDAHFPRWDAGGGTPTRSRGRRRRRLRDETWSTEWRHSTNASRVGYQ